MFAFGRGTKDGFVFLKEPKGTIFICPNESLAREYFTSIRDRCHLYRLRNDLSVAHLVQKGTGPAPMEVEPTEEQKLALWAGYVYKSLLTWAPYPDEVRCEFS